MRALFLGCVVAGCAGSQRPTEESDVEGAVRELYADLSARNWESLEKRFHPEARLVFNRKGKADAATVADFIAKNREGLKSVAVFQEKCLALDVRVHGAVAHAWSRFEGKVGAPDRLRTWSGIDAWTLVRSEGKWLVTSVAVSVDE